MQTQADTLARFYRAHRDTPIRRRVLADATGCGGSLTQRNADLRKLGFVIRSSRRKVRGRMVSYFEYVSGPRRA